jgi:hypothetical protein
MQRTIGIVLLIVGALGLAYGGFSYTRETHQVDIGPMHMSVSERQRVNVPIWGGVGALLIGGLLLVVGRSGGNG